MEKEAHHQGLLLIVIALVSAITCLAIYLSWAQRKQQDEKAESPRALLLRKIRNEEVLSENDYVKLDRIMDSI